MRYKDVIMDSLRCYKDLLLKVHKEKKARLPPTQKNNEENGKKKNHHTLYNINKKQ